MKQTPARRMLLTGVSSGLDRTLTIDLTEQGHAVAGGALSADASGVSFWITSLWPPDLAGGGHPTSPCKKPSDEMLAVMKGVADVFVESGSLKSALDSYENTVNTGPLQAALEM